MQNKNTKFIFVTGGVVSSLGKGLASASLASILQARGFKVRLKKCDPYLNVDPGLMCPFQHGEVFVTDDGTQTDLDLGHYERFSGISCNKNDSITTGKIYKKVIENEILGKYNGGTIQVVPHITNAIKEFIFSDLIDEDFVLCEIGGTVGDIEGQPYLEAIRQIAYELGRERTMFMHLTLLPYIPAAGELKTKPTQHSVKKMQEYGIQPNILLCRSQIEIPENEKQKLALFCNVPKDCVIMALDVDSIYKVPLEYSKEGLDLAVCKYFGINCKKAPDLSKWQKVVDALETPDGLIKIGVVGKYASFLEAYKSLSEALIHAGIANRHKVKINWIDSELLEHDKPEKHLSEVAAIVVPDGIGIKAIEGKIEAIKYAREKNIPLLCIGQGAQMMAIEAMRNLGKIKNAGSSEFNPNCEAIITTFDKHKRIGAFESKLHKKSLLSKIYGKESIFERHSHQYEINDKYAETFDKHGIIVSGRNKFIDAIENTNNTFAIGTMFNAELKSKPFAPVPLFVAFIDAAIKKSRLV